MGEIDKLEDIAILALIVAIGYGLYKFSDSFESAINGIFGLSSGNAATAPVGYGGTYANAANQTVMHPLTTLETILGIGANGPAPDQPAMIGSTTTW